MMSPMSPRDRRPGRTALLLALALALLMQAPQGASGKDSAYMQQAKAVVGFRFRGELAQNEIIPVSESKLPESLHHIVFGGVYASACLCVRECVCACVRACVRASLSLSLSLSLHACAHVCVRAWRGVACIMCACVWSCTYHWRAWLPGADGLLYASSFLTSEVFSASMDNESGKWRWFRVVGRGTGVDGPTGMAVDPQLRLLVASFGTDQILRSCWSCSGVVRDAAATWDAAFVCVRPL